MCSEQNSSKRPPVSYGWPRHILPAAAIATFVYLLVAQWASGFRVDWWSPWRYPVTVPLLQIAVWLVLLVYAGRRIWQGRFPLLPLAAIVLIIAGWMGLYQWSYELGKRQLDAEVASKDVADECLRMILSAPGSEQGSTLVPGLQLSNEYQAIRRLNPEWVRCDTTKTPAGEGEKPTGSVIIELTPSVAYSFNYSEETGAWVLMEVNREGGPSRLLAQLPASTKPATRPEQQANKNGE